MLTSGLFWLQVDQTEVQFYQPLREYMLYIEAMKVSHCQDRVLINSLSTLSLKVSIMESVVSVVTFVQ